MATRLVPTGTCWCGCGADVDLGSFFAPGHDKRAEARLIMEVFGGVPQFLVAFGRGPGGAEISTDASWIDSAMKLSGMTQGSRAYMAVEYPNLDDRTGPLQRIKRELVRLLSAQLADGQAVFEVTKPGGRSGVVYIPFLDVVGVYGGQNDVTARISGSLDLTGDQVRYVSFGRDDARSMTARGVLLLQELKPLKEAIMAAWHRISVQQRPPLYIEDATQVDGTTHGYAPWSGLDATVAMLGDRPRLRTLCRTFTDQLKELGSGWFRARAAWKAAGLKPSDAEVGADYIGGTKVAGIGGPELLTNTRATYNAIITHLDELVG